MQEIEYDYMQHHTPNAGDDKLLVKFFMGAVKDDAASMKEGRPIFVDKEFIDIRIPGSKENVVVRPVRKPNDIDRFPRHYAAFKARTSQETISGTPLESWHNALMTPARIEEFRAINVRTVEQLVAIADSATNAPMGLQSIKQAAVAFLEASKTAAPFAAMEEKLLEAMLKIEEQGREIARLTALASEGKKGK